MTAAEKKNVWKPEEYLAWERAQPEKHAYYQGEVFAMAGASKEHNLIVGSRCGAREDAHYGFDHHPAEELMLAHLVDLSQPLFFTVDGALSPAECAALIARIDAAGPVVAPVSRAEGPVLDLGTRNNTRVMLDDPALAALLFERVRHRVPPSLMGMRAVGANERLRCYRYARGQRFAPHYDGTFIRSDDERSLLTFMIYLNEGFVGGETALLDLERVVVPKTGMALLFQHPILHEGCVVTAGAKYAVRSDVMYRRA